MQDLYRASSSSGNGDRNSNSKRNRRNRNNNRDSNSSSHLNVRTIIRITQVLVRIIRKTTIKNIQ